MKKINLLMTIPALVAIVPATISMASCGNKTNTSDPVIDPTVSDKVETAITRNTDGSVTCKLSLKDSESEKKITKITVVKIGSITLTEGTDYSVANTNADSINVTIFKSALDKYQGSIVITPKISEFNGLYPDLNKSTFIINEENFSSTNLSVYKSYDGTQGELIPWSDSKLTIWDEDEDITEEFKNPGITFYTKGTYSFTIKYDNKFEKTISITAAKKTYTVNCSVSGSFVSINKSSITVEEGTTWGTVKSAIAISANSDVDTNALKFTWKKNGTEISDDEPITESFNAVLTYEYKASGAEIADPYAFQLLRDGGSFKCRCYVYGASTAESTTSIPSDYDSIYTFTCDLTNVSGNFRYFWVGYKPESGDSRLLKLYNENIVGVYLDNGTTTTPVLYSNNGSYLTYKDEDNNTRTFHQGDGKLIVKYRPICENDWDLYPGFEADAN